jgi:opacity protein-like surface antigen
MGSFKSLALAGVFAVAASATALAADLLPPPPPMPYGPAPVEIGSAWYLRGDVGVGALDFDKFEGVDTNPAFVGPPAGYRLEHKLIADQAFVGFGAGYKFNNWFRADLTAEYRTAAQFKTVESYIFPGQIDRGINLVEAKLASIVGLVNGYVDFGSWHGFTPFVGAGVGFARHKVLGLTDLGAGSAAGGLGFAPDKDTTKLAWALHAGVGLDISPNAKLELAYRYLNMGKAESGGVNCFNAVVCPDTVYALKEIGSHDIKLGLRWMLAAAPAPIYDAPLIRKY